MDIFKQQCRNLLSEAVPEEPADLLDIVTAYKSLKLAVNKTHYGLDKGRDHISGKGYLKPTISTKQAERITLGLPLISGSVQDQLPFIHPMI